MPRQKTPAPPPSSAPQVEAAAVVVPIPEAAPAPVAPKFRGIRAGAELPLATKGQVCTTNLPGDKITATITADVMGENGAMIPAGSIVVLEVAEVSPGETPEKAKLTLRVRSVLVNDEPMTVPSEVAVKSEYERRQVPRDKGADRRKVIGGAVAGAIVGQVMGKDTKSTVTGAVVGAAAGAGVAAASKQYDACLPVGTSLTVKTTADVSIASG